MHRRSSGSCEMPGLEGRQKNKIVAARAWRCGADRGKRRRPVAWPLWPRGALQQSASKVGRVAVPHGGSLV
jgi:hypothetical protein